MPLSEEEMRLLAQMERALVEEDPKFASTLRGTEMANATRTRMVLCSLAFAVGVAVMMSGAIFRVTWVGVLGFAVMLVSASAGLSALRQRRLAARDPERAGHRSPTVEGRGVHGGFMDRLEERWQQRRRDETEG